VSVREWGRVDVIINDAGLMPHSLLERLRVDDWNNTVNIKGVLHGIAAALSYRPLLLPLLPSTLFPKIIRSVDLENNKKIKLRTPSISDAADSISVLLVIKRIPNAVPFNQASPSQDFFAIQIRVARRVALEHRPFDSAIPGSWARNHRWYDCQKRLHRLSPVTTSVR